MEMLILTWIAGLTMFVLDGVTYASSPKFHKQQRSLRSTREISADGYVTVQVDGGLLRGRISMCATGESMTSFQGIPYAKPPIGNLRFMNPVPFEGWNGTRDALKERSICPQFKNGSVVGNEDCLYLNIYTRNLPSDKHYSLIPVMVWIHGGYFIRGSGNRDNYGPDYLLKEDIIVVTMNYRLGPLGFLFMPDTVPGNAGMKDQVLALRWIQSNIQVFGGDPNLVTIFGQSAGAASVHLHTLSPLSKGLFHRAIAQSGSAIQKVFVPSSPLETSQRLAKAVSCTGGNATATVECMQKVNVESLLIAGIKSVSTVADRKRFLSFPFLPTPESKTGVNKFLPESAINLLQAGKHHDVPYLTGYTDAESLLIFSCEIMKYTSIETVVDIDEAVNYSPEFLNSLHPPGLSSHILTFKIDDPTILLKNLDSPSQCNGIRLCKKMDPKVVNLYNEAVQKYFDSSWTDRILNDILYLEKLKGRDAETSLRNFYMQGRTLSNSTLQGFLNMLTDIYGECITHTLEYMEKSNKAPLYLYYFRVDDTLNEKKKELGIKFPGASHGDDLCYLFHMDKLPEVSENSTAEIARRNMVRLWANFAKYGDPGYIDEHTKWLPYETKNKYYLELGNPPLTLKKHTSGERAKFWEEFHEIYGVLHMK